MEKALHNAALPSPTVFTPQPITVGPRHNRRCNPVTLYYTFRLRNMAPVVPNDAATQDIFPYQRCTIKSFAPQFAPLNLSNPLNT